MGSVSEFIKRRCREQSGHGRQYRLDGALIVVAEATEQMSVRDVARELRAPAPSIVRAIGTLVSEGLVVQRRREDDGRLVALSLTAKGRRVAASLIEQGV